MSQERKAKECRLWFICSNETFIILPVVYGALYLTLLGAQGYGLLVHPHLEVQWFLVLLATWCHITCMTTNPGVVPSDASPMEWGCSLHAMGEGKVPMCRHCKRPKPPRSHHCSTCGVCVLKMDHHCPWVNTCVGQHNQKFFIQFCVYTCLLCLNMLVQIFSYFCEDPKDKGDKQTKQRVAKDVLSQLILIVAIAFGVFTAVMAYTQITMVAEDTTTIEGMQCHKEEPRSGGLQALKINAQYSRVREGFRKVFGHKPSFHWFVPTNVVAQQTMLWKLPFKMLKTLKKTCSLTECYHLVYKVHASDISNPSASSSVDWRGDEAPQREPSQEEPKYKRGRRVWTGYDKYTKKADSKV